MVESEFTWVKVRQEAARVVDVAGEIQRIVGWPEERVRDESGEIAGLLALKDDEGLTVLFEICLMRQRLQMSEKLSENLQFALVKVMWAHEWTADEVKNALKEVFSRLQVTPPLPSEGIKVLLGVASRYRRVKRGRRWPNREARRKCAELMWLMDTDEDTVASEMHTAMERFNMGRGDEGKALDALREIELIYRRIRIGIESKTQARKFAEIMWLRGWDLQKARAEVSVAQMCLGLPSEKKSVAVLLEICLLCGGKDRPNRVSETVENLWEAEADFDVAMDQHLTELAQYLWLEGYTLQQAMEKVGRFARVNNASLATTLEVLSTLSHERYRARKEEGGRRKEEG